MKIYSKKLTTIKELKREKQLLKKRMQLDEPKAREEKKDDSDNQSFIAGLISGASSGSWINTAINVAPTIIDMVKARKMRTHPGMQSLAVPVPEAKPSVVARAVREFLGGYVKWKALELTYKGLRIALKSDAAKTITRQTGEMFSKMARKVSRH